MAEHHRVSPEGKQLGRISAALQQRGHRRLDAAGLTGHKWPGARSTMCASCACRPGTVPNGCMQTQMDLLKAVADGEPFLCHAPRDGLLCAGWMGARAAHCADPMPTALVELLQQWEYTKDEPEGEA
jgi:hypothetical protein